MIAPRRMLITVMLSLSTATHAMDIPEFTPNVVDRTGTLSSDEVTSLNEKIESLRMQSQIWAAVLIVESTGNEDIEQVATEAFEKWELGQAETDNGLLIVVVKRDRKMRLEVGYGLEGSITDAQASRIIREVIAPNFKVDQYFAGLNAALDVCNDLVLHNASGLLPESEESEFAHLKELASIWFTLIVVAPILLRLCAVLRASRYSSYPLQPTTEERSGWRILFLSGTSVFLTVFLLINPGIFFVLTWNELPVLTPFLVLFAYLFLLSANWGYIAMLSEARREKFKKNSSGSAPYPQAFNAGFNSGSSRSGSSSSFSSSSSSSSRSSSSGGGRSGGGGASGSW